MKNGLLDVLTILIMQRLVYIWNVWEGPLILSSRYENLLLNGDFDAEVSDMSMKDFCDIYSSNKKI